MALIDCQECKRQISDQAAACPHCGCPTAKARPTPPPVYRAAPPAIPQPQQVIVQARPPKKGIGVAGCLLILFALILIPAMLASLGGSKPEPSAPEKKEKDWGGVAWYAARDYVRDHLKAPSTAKFSSLVWDEKTGWAPDGTNRWTTFGFVDAQNTFGAMLRQDWYAVVERRDEKFYILYWRLGNEQFGAPPK